MNNIPQLVNRTTLILAAVTAGLGAAYACTANDGLLIGAVSCGTALYHTVSRAFIGPMVTKFQDRWDPESLWFREHSFEAKLYRLLRVKKWKDKLPTYAPAAFSLKDRDPMEIIRASCNAELVHEICMATGFLPLALVPFLGAFWVFFLTSLATALADSLFVIIQRFNRPRLMRLAAKAKKTAKQAP